ncbi:MAG: hypothetical protein DA330_01090 [Nitrososphaera sp.]|nr:hypothetical protein [Nitrososphaera sp.]
MSSLSQKELQVLKTVVQKAAKHRQIVAACVYGSRAAGYARPDSDIDVIVVLQDYPYSVKYVYKNEQRLEIAALLVDKKALEKDALQAGLGEFVVGRLLHVYDPIINPDFFSEIEQSYKKRIILEEIREMVGQTNLLCSEISFPLEYILFEKVRRRTALYPNAAYSYYKTYANDSNLKFALDGYKRALAEIISEDGELFSVHGDCLRISERRVHEDSHVVSLRMAKKLQEFSSYFVHTYAGRKTMHLAIREAESKIKRYVAQNIDFPDFMSCPSCVYWKLDKAILIADSRVQDWTDMLAGKSGFQKYSLTKKRLGNPNSRTMLYVFRSKGNERKVAVKKMAKTKAIKWAALSMWTAPVKKFKIDPLHRLATAYKAAAAIRKLGLLTPEIEAVVLDGKLLVTSFVEGQTLAGLIKSLLAGKEETDLINEAARQMAKVHATGASFGDIKPKNVIINDGLYFTDLEQFVFENGDPAWDVAQFLCWGLKNTRNVKIASKITRDFLASYSSPQTAKKLESGQYIEIFYPVLAPQIAHAIKNELRKAG